MREIYLDNAATTKPCKKAVEKILEMLTIKYGNPSSLHEKGLEAEKEVELARTQVAKMLNANPKEIYFTSGGTEANNIALLGGAEAQKRRGKKIITTAIEHSSVYNSTIQLEKYGFEVEFLLPNSKGEISVNQLSRAIDANTILVSVMMVNNEVGSILPVEKIKDVIKEKNSPAILHVDAVQAFGKFAINVERLGVDLLTISAHKVYGPKGVGALYKRDGVRISARTFGGEQQKKLRPGTEPVPLIAGFGAAVENLVEQKDDNKKISFLNRYLREKLLKMDDIIINSPTSAAEHIINFSTNKIKSETMLHFLAARGIYVSSGSACSKGKKSRVLSIMQLSSKRIETAIRVSFGRDNTQHDVDELLAALKDGIAQLTHI